MMWRVILAFGLMGGIMAFAWGLQGRTRNGGWVDVCWSFGTGATGALAAASVAGNWRGWLVAALCLVWGVRLGAYLWVRTAGSAHEDVRYARLRREWGAGFNGRMFGFLMIQAAVGAMLALCVMVAALNKAPAVRVADGAGLLIMLVAVGGEALADRQMHAFRRNPAHKGQVCMRGLWGWSRHPNYFFEALLWAAYPCFAIGPQGLLAYATLLGPIAMAWLLTQASGIPMLEREMLNSRGEAYRAYQARVSSFIPWPPKKA